MSHLTEDVIPALEKRAMVRESSLQGRLRLYRKALYYACGDDKAKVREILKKAEDLICEMSCG